MIKKWIKYLVIIIICVLLIPICVHIIYKAPAINPFWTSIWGPEDLLAYAGTMTGSVCTVLGVFFSIRYTQRNYEEDTRMKALPYIVVTPLRSKIKFDLFNDTIQSEKDESNGYEEYQLGKVYIIIENGKTLIKEKLSKQQLDLLYKNGVRKVPIGDSEALIKSPLISQPLLVENVGNGAAVHFRIGASDKNGKIERSMVPISLPVNRTFAAHLYCDNYKSENLNCGNYKFGIYYDDIYGNSYMQIHKFKIEINKKENEYRLIFNVDAKQESSDILIENTL